MIYYTSGQQFWTIVRRYHLHRDNPAMLGVAARELRRLRETSDANPAIRRAIDRFLLKNSPKPVIPPVNGGGKTA